MNVNKYYARIAVVEAQNPDRIWDCAGVREFLGELQWLPNNEIRDVIAYIQAESEPDVLDVIVRDFANELIGGQ